MKLLALAEGADHVCFRYRLAAFRPALERAGWQLQCVPLAKGALARRQQLYGAADADAIVLQRKLLPLWQLRLLRKRARRLIFDVDDAVFHRDSYHRKGIQSWQRMAYFWATVYAADAVLTGNDFLRRQAAALIEPHRVHYFPTCVDPSRYSLARHEPGERLRLVWIGQRSTVPSLQAAGEHLAVAAARLRDASVGNALRGVPRSTGDAAPPLYGTPQRAFLTEDGAARSPFRTETMRLTGGLELRVVSDVFAKLAGVEVVERPWSEAGETTELAAADVGVSWLPDDDWSRGKCGLKVLQYMAAGLPVVANRVGVHTEMIVDGQTGYLADTPAEWAAAIARLAADARLRAALGAAARRRVEEQYSVAAWQDRFVGLLDGLVDRDGGLHHGDERRERAA